MPTAQASSRTPLIMNICSRSYFPEGQGRNTGWNQDRDKEHFTLLHVCPCMCDWLVDRNTLQSSQQDCQYTCSPYLPASNSAAQPPTTGNSLTTKKPRVTSGIHLSQWFSTFSPPSPMWYQPKGNPLAKAVFTPVFCLASCTSKGT